MQFHLRYRSKKISLAGAILVLAMVASGAKAQASEYLGTLPSSSAESHIIRDQIGEWRSQSRPEIALPTEAMLTEIATWLSATFELPMISDHPRVEFVSAMRLATLRYKGLLPGRTDQIDVNDPAMQASSRPDIVGVYNDNLRTIYLVDTWVETAATDVSVLVHEMVHHLQNLAELKYECAGAREKPAYLAQEAWLQRYGLDLEHEFEIDKFTLFIKSSCMF